MKHLLTILLLLSLSVQLCGCLAQPYETMPSPDTTQENTQSSSESDIIDSITQKPMYSVTLSNIEATEKAEDGTILLTTKHQNISLVLPEQEVADAIILDFLGRMDQGMQHAESMLSSAKEAYSMMENWASALLLNYYSTRRIDTSVLSLHGMQRTYQPGAAHSYESGKSVTYDLLTGKVLQLPDILSHNVTGDSLLQVVLNALESTDSSHRPNLFPSHKDSLKQFFSVELAKMDNWYLSDDCLVFYFDPYEIGPYSEGIIEIAIPYSELTGILKDAYFPAEADKSIGVIKCTPFEDANLDDFTQFSEVILNEGADKILLYTDGTVSNIRICAGPKGTLFADNVSHEDHVFASYTLTPGDAIMIEANLSETTLLVGYQADDGYRISTVIMENGNITIK